MTRLLMGIASALAIVLAVACGDDADEAPPPRVATSASLAGAWTCASETNCQDVWDVDLGAGLVTLATTTVTGGSASQLALYAPGVALGGTNLLTGSEPELRCRSGAGCDDFAGGERVEYAVTTAGTYRVAVTRDWANSCGGSGTFTLEIASPGGVTVRGQTVNDVASAASGITCP